MKEPESEIQHFSRLIIRSMCGEVTADEEQELQAWKKQSAEHKKVCRQLEDEIYLKKEFARYKSSFDYKGWIDIQQKIIRKQRKKRNEFFRWMGYAALFVAVFAVGYLFRGLKPETASFSKENYAEIVPGSPCAVLELADGRTIRLGSGAQHERLTEAGIRSEDTELVYQPDAESEIEYHTLKVPLGGEYKLTLGDGTQVWLNSATILHYPNRFSGAERRVKIEGEAYFRVAKDVAHPFIVATDDLAIRVTGTEFNVMAYEDENRVETTLVKGGVEVGAGNKKVTLEPGHQAVFSKADRQLATQQVNTAFYTSWKDGVFEFEDMPLPEICRQLSRWYDVEISLQSANLANIRFTGAIKKEKSIEFILGVIGNTQAVTYEVQGKKIVLKKK